MRKRNMFLSIFIFCLFFAGINGVSAGAGYCPAGAEVQKAYACDYSSSGLNGSSDYTLLFIKTSNGYCSEVNQLDLFIKGSDTPVAGWVAQAIFGEDASSSYDDERRKVTTFELDNAQYENIFNNKTCPRIKAVFTTNGFGQTGLNSLIITIPGMGPIDDIQCGFSGNVAYWDSFCLISDGKNFREITSEDAEDVIEDANDDREGPSIAEILNWASNNGYNDVDSLGDDCSLISDELKKILNTAFWLISVVAIIILVVLTALGFIKAIVASDDQKLKDAFSHLLTRIIVLIILLLLPIILTFIIELINDNFTGQVAIGEDDNIFCDVTGSSSASSSNSNSDSNSSSSSSGEETSEGSGSYQNNSELVE